jgi:hypothetical protein
MVLGQMLHHSGGDCFVVKAVSFACFAGGDGGGGMLLVSVSPAAAL